MSISVFQTLGTLRTLHIILLFLINRIVLKPSIWRSQNSSYDLNIFVFVVFSVLYAQAKEKNWSSRFHFKAWRSVYFRRSVYFHSGCKPCLKRYPSRICELCYKAGCWLLTPDAFYCANANNYHAQSNCGHCCKVSCAYDQSTTMKANRQSPSATLTLGIRA